jgi:hypothetical protein
MSDVADEAQKRMEIIKKAFFEAADNGKRLHKESFSRGKLVANWTFAN